MLYTFASYLAKNLNRVKIDPGCADVWVFITMLMRVKPEIASGCIFDVDCSVCCPGGGGRGEEDRHIYEEV